MAEYQPSLLSSEDQQASDLSWAYNRVSGSDIPMAELQEWKQRLYRFQRQVAESPCQQGSLFDAAPPLATTIDPFQLPLRNAEFWRGQFQDTGVPALYFVIDHELPILLYVGETVKSNQRWKGVHDCKRYILSYISAHRPHGVAVTVNIGFWPHAPAQRKQRQALESELIHRWRSPFNKENWSFWSTPFVAEQVGE